MLLSIEQEQCNTMQNASHHSFIRLIPNSPASLRILTQPTSVTISQHLIHPGISAHWTEIPLLNKKQTGIITIFFTSLKSPTTDRQAKEIDRIELIQAVGLSSSILNRKIKQINICRLQIELCVVNWRKWNAFSSRYRKRKVESELPTKLLRNVLGYCKESYWLL